MTDYKYRIVFFFLGLLAASVIVLVSFGVAVIGNGLDHVPIPGFERIQDGMSVTEVRGILGEESGSMTAHELRSYHRHRWNEEPPILFSQVEQTGGKHLLWFSRNGAFLVFNVVSFNEQNRVAGKYTGNEAFLGLREH